MKDIYYDTRFILIYDQVLIFERDNFQEINQLIFLRR